MRVLSWENGDRRIDSATLRRPATSWLPTRVGLGSDWGSPEQTDTELRVTAAPFVLRRAVIAEGLVEPQRVELPPPEDSRRAVAAILLPWATPAQYRI